MWLHRYQVTEWYADRSSPPWRWRQLTRWYQYIGLRSTTSQKTVTLIFIIFHCKTTQCKIHKNSLLQNLKSITSSLTFEQHIDVTILSLRTTLCMLQRPATRVQFALLCSTSLLHSCNPFEKPELQLAVNATYQILWYANNLFYIFTVEPPPPLKINLEDKPFIHEIKKSLQWELCQKQTQNYN